MILQACKGAVLSCVECGEEVRKVEARNDHANAHCGLSFAHERPPVPLSFPRSFALLQVTETGVEQPHERGRHTRFALVAAPRALSCDCLALEWLEGQPRADGAGRRG